MNSVLLLGKNTAPSVASASSNSAKKPYRKKRRRDSLKQICWCVFPLAVMLLLVADGIGVYIFTTERLLVLGACILVILLPCFSEISIKDFTMRRNKHDK